MSIDPSILDYEETDLPKEICPVNHGRGGFGTYAEIKEYVLATYGLKVSSLYIAQTKDKVGIKERENYYLGEGKSKKLTCPKEKEEAIISAFRHFNMI